MNKLLWFLAGMIMSITIITTAHYANAFSERGLENGDYEMKVHYNMISEGISFNQLRQDFPSIKSLTNTSTTTIIVFDGKNFNPQDIRRARILLRQLETNNIQNLVAKYSNDNLCIRTSTRQVYCATVSNVVGGQPVLTWNLK